MLDNTEPRLHRYKVGVYDIDQQSGEERQWSAER
jgi:hypothetical protein